MYILAWILVVLLLIFTRVWGLNWGLPFPFHPDERNMAAALQQLSLSNGFNPHFFAYGQFPLYVSYILVKLYQIVTGGMHQMSFPEATMGLRVLSAIFSVLTFLFLILTTQVLWSVDFKKRPLFIFLFGLPLVFVPFFIQAAHFGTTESLLLAAVSALLYAGVLFEKDRLSVNWFMWWSVLWWGISCATKVSSLPFGLIPVLFLLTKQPRLSPFGVILNLVLLGLGTVLLTVLFSPHLVLSYADTMTTLSYEIGVAQGTVNVFYTRQFFQSLPALFQFEKIFPYALGWPLFGTALVGFLVLPWKRSITVLRLLTIIFAAFYMTSFAKWTRFMVPLYPLLILFGLGFLVWLAEQSKMRAFIAGLLAVTIMVPGVMFLSVYTQPDARWMASAWMLKNISPNALVVSENGNVVDLPLGRPAVTPIDFYSIDENPDSQRQLSELLTKADYIIVPSRRVFANLSCETPAGEKPFYIAYPLSHCTDVENRYPKTSQYYRTLFSKNFKLVKEFGVNPQDEFAEETWTVFDHPMIRIYKRS